jgi:hypothetical protein
LFSDLSGIQEKEPYGSFFRLERKEERGKRKEERGKRNGVK